MGIREPLVASAPLLNFKKHLNRTILEISYTDTFEQVIKDMYVRIFSAALFILAKKLQIVRCLLLEKWLNKAELNVIK